MFDLLGVSKQYAQLATPGNAGYSPFYDVDGSGGITILDVIDVRNRQLSRLPAAMSPSIRRASRAEALRRILPAASDTEVGSCRLGSLATLAIQEGCKIAGIRAVSPRRLTKRKFSYHAFSGMGSRRGRADGYSARHRPIVVRGSGRVRSLGRKRAWQYVAGVKKNAPCVGSTLHSLHKFILMNV